YTYSPTSPSQGQTITFTPGLSGQTYNWTFTGSSSFQGGTNGSSQAPQVQWATGGSYNVSLTVTDNTGCFTTTQQTVNVTTCTPSVYSFTTCSATGSSGPTQSMCNSAYGTGVVTVTGGIQTW